MYKLIFLIFLSLVGCQPTIMNEIDELQEMYEEELNQILYEISLVEGNNNMLEDKYCEEYIDKYDVEEFVVNSSFDFSKLGGK